MGGWAGQSGFDVRFEWGLAGVAALAPEVHTLVVVDVLRFTTAAEAALSRGASVYPYPSADPSALAFARSVGAVVARRPPGPSLSPGSLLDLSPGTAVVLPSPNGATCAAAAGGAGTAVMAACLRNAPAVAHWLAGARRPLGVVACGERWPDGSLRPALEDALGAGALIDRLPGARSPEAEGAAALWRSASSRLPEVLLGCASGQELVGKGLGEDVEYAAAAGVSGVVPVLVDGALRDAGRLGV